MLLPGLLRRVFLLAWGLLLLLAGLVGALAWLALAGVLLLLLLVGLLRHFLHSFRLVIGKPGWLVVGSWSPTYGKPFCRRTRRKPELCELAAIT